MAANSEFFGARDAKAVLKHGLLARYAVYFAGRAGKATGGKVVFIDGYAGEGRYKDGNPGSPLLLAGQAKHAETMGRAVRLALVEQDDDRREKLKATLEEEGVKPDAVLERSLDDEIDGLLQRFSEHAVLLFVDPFGLAISRSTLERILRGRSRSQPIDVIYHFSLSSARRQGPLGITDKYGALHSAAQMDAALGADTWRGEFSTSTGDEGAATSAARRVAAAFGDAVGGCTGTKTTSIEVRKRPHHLPEYLLTLFSADRQAHWAFADMAGKTYVDWLHHCDLEDFNANLRAEADVGLIPLFDPVEPEVDRIEALLKKQAAAYLKENVERVLAERGSVYPVDCIPELYGEMLGRARAMHLRATFKELHSSGLVDDHARGDRWETRKITWTPN